MYKSFLVLFAFSHFLINPAQAQAVKNETEVIPGKLSRAGTTNRKPYSDETLKGLCERGFTLAVYVYAKAATRTVSCSKGSITYVQQGGWTNPSRVLALSEQEYNKGGRVMIHCWYGVHASNFLTAAHLNRFCGWTGDQAAAKFLRDAPAGISSKERNDLTSRLRALGRGSSVMNGCPHP